MLSREDGSASPDCIPGFQVGDPEPSTRLRMTGSFQRAGRGSGTDPWDDRSPGSESWGGDSGWSDSGSTGGGDSGGGGGGDSGGGGGGSSD